MGDGWKYSSIKNPETLFPCKLTEDIIYLVKNTPQYDDLVLRIIYEPYTNEYDDDEDP